MDSYDPLADPLALPVQSLSLDCTTEAPLCLPPRPGSTPGTTLCGAFGRALWDCACLRRQQGAPACNINPPSCLAPAHCALPWLYKPYSPVQRRNLTRPVLLAAPALETGQAVQRFELQVTLWGRHAIAARDVVLDTLHAVGRSGLSGHEARVRFAVTAVADGAIATLAERVSALAYRDWRRALLLFETPFLYRETVQIDAGHSAKLFLAGGTLPLAGILGNVAYDLAAWDMEDRGVGESLNQRQRYDLARQARNAARAAAETLRVVRSELHPIDLGARIAKTDGRAFPLQGFLGLAEVEGPMAALPWLLALSLGGGGQKRAMGFGSVSLWLRPCASNLTSTMGR